MNVLLILIDTLRADHLGCYGYPLPTSPNIDRLAEQSITFDRCYAPGIPTTPAHASIYTGLHPLEHNIVTHGGRVDLDRRIPVLGELLQKAGRTTCAIDNLYDIKPWLTRGYEFYVNPAFRHPMRLLVSCDEINSRAIPWLRSHSREPFFMFVHYWEPHTPYMPPERHRLFWDDRDPCDPAVETLAPIRRTPFWGMFGDTWIRKLGPITDADYIRSLYDGEIHRVDHGVGNLLSALEESGAAEDTLVILTSDHGEVMARGGIFFDHHGLYEDTIRVPLMMRVPGGARAGERHANLVAHTDIAPTILAASGARSAPGMGGADLLGLLPERDSVICCECTWQAKWAMRTRTHKVIVSREPDRYGTPMRELYDLRTDPDEAHNIADDQPDLAGQMAGDLEAWIAAEMARTGRTEDPLVAQGITLGRRWETMNARQ